MRRSHDGAGGLGPLHLVSAWASEQGIALGQIATEEKSNEITAIPDLIDQIDIQGAVVTIDAMGCQKEIAKKIKRGGGDYVLAVKDNQPTLHQALQEFFVEELDDLEHVPHRRHETHDKGHGRPAAGAHTDRVAGLAGIATTENPLGDRYSMRLVIVSDTHSRHENLAPLSGEVLIHCGDFCNGFSGDEDDLVCLDDWFARQPFDLILCTGGNHDFVAQGRHAAGRNVFQNAVYLQDSPFVFRSVHFYGAPWVPQLQGWAYYLSDSELKVKWKLIPDNTDVLITHTPPWRILDSPTNPRIHAGCSHLLARVDELKPTIHCFGHNHASHGRRNTTSTAFLNASVVNSQYEVVNQPFVIDP